MEHCVSRLYHGVTHFCFILLRLVLKEISRTERPIVVSCFQDEGEIHNKKKKTHFQSERTADTATFKLLFSKVKRRKQLGREEKRPNTSPLITKC
jgi:hypothetical protein